MSLTQSRFQVVGAPQYTPEVGSFVAMLEHCRESVLESVREMTVAQLNHQHDKTSNPIGALLGHITAIEWFYATLSFEGRAPKSSEWGEWGNLLRLSPTAWNAARDLTIEQHVERLSTVRARTLAALATRTDAWLAETFALPWTPQPANNRWALYHLLEDELNHRGQIRWLKSRLPQAS